MAPTYTNPLLHTNTNTTIHATEITAATTTTITAAAAAVFAISAQHKSQITTLKSFATEMKRFTLIYCCLKNNLHRKTIS